MGYSISWLAVHGKDAGAVKRELGLKGTGQYEEVPESPLLGAQLPGNWYLIFANRCDYADDTPLATLSQKCAVITCTVEEHIMFSSASSWRDGRLIWRIDHNAEEALEHLDAEGDLPEVFASLRERLSAKQAQNVDADYSFDVPVEVAKAITGFRHDESEPSEGFERLLEPKGEAISIPKKKTLSPSKKWWQIWR